MSRYDDEPAMWVNHPTRGRVLSVHRNTPIWPVVEYTNYVAVMGDQFDYLAHRMYGNSRDYWYMADMNPKVMCPDDLPYGDVIQLPLTRVRTT